jgi:hypothetical protein
LPYEEKRERQRHGNSSEQSGVSDDGIIEPKEPVPLLYE